MKKIVLPFMIVSGIMLTGGRSLAQDTFTQMAQPNLTAANTQYVQLYDWNDDGNLDLFYSDLSQFGYRLGSSSGAFGSFVSFGSFDDPRGFVFTDYDNDGLDDIVLGTADEDRALTNLGDGTVDDNSVGINGFTINLDVSDFNKDGFMDAISTNGQVYLNTGNSSPRFARMTFSQQNSVSIPSGFNPGDYHLADLDNDGDDDILVASRGGQNIIFETISLTGTTFNYNTLRYNSSTGDTRRFATADFDLDGNLDIVTLQRGLGHNISFGKGGLLTDEFANWEDITLVALPTINSRDVEIFDFNYDGLPDILISGEVGEAYLLRNNGARSFSLQQSFSISNINIFDAAIGDIDGNGSPDIVFGINGTADQVWLNNLVPPTATVSSSENDPTSSGTIQIDLSFDRVVSEPSVEDFTITNASISSILPNISNSYTLSTTDLVTSFISNRAFLTKDLNGNFISSGRVGSTYELGVFDPQGEFLQTIYSSSVQADYAGAIDENNILYFLAEISGGIEILRFDAQNNYSPLSSIQVLGYTPVRASQLNSGMAVGPNGEIAISALVGNSSRRLLVIDSSGNVLSDSNVTDGEYHFASDGKLLNCRGLFTGSNRGARFRVYDPDNNYDKIFEDDLIITSNIVDAVAFDKDDRIYVTRESTTSVDVWQYQYNSQAMTIDSVRSTKLQNRALNVFEDRFGIINALTFDGPTNFIEKVSSSGYQVNLLPQQSGVVAVQLEAGSVLDSLGIANLESNTFSINYIDPVPSVNISTLSNGPAAAELNVTIDFSEVVTGFELADIQVANASLSDFTEVSSGQSFTVLVSPTSNGTLTIDVPAGVASDTDSNPNNAASQFSIPVSLLSATFNEDLAIPCSGGTGAVSYTVTGGTSPYDFQWQGTGSNGQFITDFNLFTSAVADEPYTVNIRDVNGYLITETFTLAEPDAITFTVVEENSICAGNDTGSITITAQGGTGNLEYTIDGGANFQPSNIFTGLEAGDYDVGVRDENICLTLPYTSVAITEPSLPGAPTATFNSSTTYGASVQIDLAAADAETNFYAVGFGQAISGGTLFEDGTQINSGDVISVKNSGNVLEFIPSSTGMMRVDFTPLTAEDAACVVTQSNISVVSVTVSPAALTITVDNQTKSYGAANPGLTVTYAGFANDEDETVLDILPTVATVASQSSDVGTYAITASGADDPNYTFTYTDGTLTVDKAALNVTANNKTITLGDPLPTLNGVLTGIVNSDNISVTYATTATASSPAGTYPITVILNDPDTRLGNYTTTITDGVLTIEPVLNVEENNVRIYPNPTENSLTIEGLEYDNYQVISMDGKVKQANQRKEVLDLLDLEAGQYVLQLMKGVELIHIQTIIKR